MKRRQDNLKKSSSKRVKLPETVEENSAVYEAEWDNALSFFKKQRFSIWDNWDFSTLLPGFTPNFKCKRCTKDGHSFIEVNQQLIAMPNSKNEPTALLGQGGQGVVKLATLISTEKVAVKIQKIRKDAVIDPIKQQQKLMIRPVELEAKILKHENLLVGELIRYPAMEDPNSPYSLKRYTAMKLVKGEDLHRININQLSVHQRLTIALLCVENLKRIHAGHFVHGDIKPDNIKVKIDGEAISVQIIDFGLSVELPAGESDMAIPFPFGSIEYVPPEAYNQLRIGYHSDIYSLGVVFEKTLKIDSTICAAMTSYDAQERLSIDGIILQLNNALQARTTFDTHRRIQY